MKQYSYYVYILASKRNGTLYTGVTDNLLRRVYEHKNKLKEGFTKKYNVTMLVYFENFDSINLAIAREKDIKAWERNWKIKIIEEMNPQWKDLFYDIGGTDNMFDEYFEELKRNEIR